MIEEKEASKQVNRMSGLNFFAQGGKAAIKELVEAMRTAMTPDIAVGFTNQWLEMEQQCPKPAEIRRGIGELNEARRATLDKCPACGGTGAIIRWYLVTYRGNSYNVKKSERLQMTWEETLGFGEKLAQSDKEWNTANPGRIRDRQTILSGAAACSCRKSA